MNDQSALELLTDEFWENNHDEPLAIENTWTRVLIWDTHRAEDRYIRQDITAYALAHSSELGELDWEQYQDYLHADDPWENVDYGEIVFEVHEASEVHVYDGEEFDSGLANLEYAYPFDTACDNLIDAEKAAENYVRNLNPEHLKPIT